MFLTIEDQTGPANIVVWPKLFEKRRQFLLGTSMMAINGRIQREGDVVHLVAQQLFDLSSDLFSLAVRDVAFKLTASPGDEFAPSSLRGGDSRDRAPLPKLRDMYCP